MVRNSNSRSIDPTSSRVRRRHDRRRLEILSAAAKTFRRQGFAATGMRDIAAEADLSPANLYHYFRGKQELLYFCQDHSLNSLLSALESARRARRSPRERLRGVIEAHVRCVLDEIDGAAAHLELEELPRDLRRRLIRKRDRYEQGLRRLIADGVASGTFAPCDPKLVARAILGALNWTVRWFRPEGTRTAGEIAGEFSAFLVRGLENGYGNAETGSGRPHSLETGARRSPKDR